MIQKLALNRGRRPTVWLRLQLLKAAPFNAGVYLTWPGDHTLRIACLGINGLLANAVQVSMYASAAHVYPTRIRATGVAYAATAGRAGGLVTSLLGRR